MSVNHETRAWPALWSLMIGFFMILVDSTIVAVAIPAIMEGLHADINQVIWVNSSYLLAFAVPLLITGRLGDRLGPKTVYLVGLVIFTLASAWCGLSGTVGMLIIARVVQGLGASMMSPQTMTVITRLFPPQQRGTAMGVWGAAAGVATLVGPLLGGVLIDVIGWEWIFFINVPVGVIGFVMAMKLLPQLPRHSHNFDWVGVVLSAVGLSLVVFGIQEGQGYNWGTIVGPISVWLLIVSGVVVLIGFVLWQRFNRDEPLVPLGLFRDRNFSLANLAMLAMGFVVASQVLPLMIYFQDVLGLNPTRAALVLLPMAVISGALSPLVGGMVDSVNPKYFAATGFALISIALFWYAFMITPTTSVWLLLLPAVLLGLANAGIWSALSVSATRNLSPGQAGAGSGVYNTTRQIGSVFGSAAIASMMEARIAANFPPGAGAGATEGTGADLPDFLLEPFATAMGQSLLLPAVVVLLGFACSLFLARPRVTTDWTADAAAPEKPLAGTPRHRAGD